MKTILGLNHGEINSSACIVENGTVIAGAPEERFNRQKLTKDFPHNAIRYCLQAAKKTLDACDAVAQGWNPGATWVRFHPGLTRAGSNREGYLYSIPDNLFQHITRQPGDWLLLGNSPEAKLPPVYFVNHHRSHAAGAYFLSPFDEAAILTCDFRGELECTTFVHGKDNALEVLQRELLPHSLGMFYATLTELLGYKPDNDEWKVMALGALDSDHNGKVVYDKLRRTYQLHDNGSFELDQSFFKGMSVEQPNLFTEKLIDLLGGKIGTHGEEPEDWHVAVASGLQLAAEEIAGHFLNHLFQITKSRRLAVSGGFFMNSLFNGKILDRTPFEELYVPYAPTDAGNSIGAALFVNHCIFDEPRSISNVYATSFIGPSYNKKSALNSLVRRGIPHSELSNPCATIAKLLADGNPVAVVEGSMEFGDRALGHRSILADPRSASIKDRINESVKYRESFRPFAPAILIERTCEVFDVRQGFQCPYMEKVVAIRKSWRNRIPAVVHADGSGRVQTVTKKDNPFFYQILSEFERITGVPVLLNTSFNLNGEPIVLTPDDALTSFFNSGLQHLVVCGYHIFKK